MFSIDFRFELAAKTFERLAMFSRSLCYSQLFCFLSGLPFIFQFRIAWFSYKLHVLHQGVFLYRSSPREVENVSDLSKANPSF